MLLLFLLLLLLLSSRYAFDPASRSCSGRLELLDAAAFFRATGHLGRSSGAFPVLGGGGVNDDNKAQLLLGATPDDIDHLFDAVFAVAGSGGTTTTTTAAAKKKKKQQQQQRLLGSGTNNNNNNNGEDEEEEEEEEEGKGSQTAESVRVMCCMAAPATPLRHRRCRCRTLRRRRD